jgi:LmbE family N-acetylglucosaminyl deacetylase
MKLTSNLTPNSNSLIAFGAHPDDIEFGCGAVIAQHTRLGNIAHLVVCSRGEAGTYGTPEVRTQEAQAAAKILRATIDILELDGDAHLEVKAAHTVRLAQVLRQVRPEIVLAPSPEPNQHPDHSKLGQMVRDATRLARYGGVAELKDLPPVAVRQLWFYALSLDSEPRDISPVLFDVSSPEVIADWTAAMEAHQSQTTARAYVQLQLTRARLQGVRAGIEYAIALFPNDPPVINSLTAMSKAANSF